MVSAFDLASWNAPQIEVLQSAQMSAVVKVVLVAVCADALVFVVLRFIVPLVAMHKAGVGVEIPLSKRIAAAYPKLAVYLFVLGWPLLFAALVATGIWLLRLRISPR